MKRPSHLTVMGLCSTLSMVFGQSLLGPLAFLPSSVRPSAPLIFTGMVLITLSFAGSITSTFARLHFALMRKGYAEDIATFVVLTGEQNATKIPAGNEFGWNKLIVVE